MPLAERPVQNHEISINNNDDDLHGYSALSSRSRNPSHRNAALGAATGARTKLMGHLQRKQYRQATGVEK